MNENMKAWLRELRTTDKEQGKDALCNVVRSADPDTGRFDKFSYAFCCLGVGQAMLGTEPSVMVSHGMSLASREFVEWLGLEVPSGGESRTEDVAYDLVVDWPESYSPSRHPTRKLFSTVTCSRLNDDYKLTFSQIADVIEYFGIKEAEYTE